MPVNERRKAFRLLSGLPGRITVVGGPAGQGGEFGCFVCDISETGCKVAVEGAGFGHLATGARVRLVLFAEKEIRLEGGVVRHADEVPGWGVAVGVHFQGQSAAVRRYLRQLFHFDDPHVCRKSWRSFRRRRWVRKLRNGLVTAAVLIAGFVLMIYLRKMPEVISDGADTVKHEAVRLARDEWRRMSPDEREEVIDVLSRDDINRVSEHLTEREKRELYERLSEQERARLREKFLRESGQ